MYTSANIAQENKASMIVCRLITESQCLQAFGPAMAGAKPAMQFDSCAITLKPHTKASMHCSKLQAAAHATINWIGKLVIWAGPSHHPYMMHQTVLSYQRHPASMCLYILDHALHAGSKPGNCHLECTNKESSTNNVVQ